jgi:hypothetical protein
MAPLYLASFFTFSAILLVLLALSFILGSYDAAWAGLEKWL